MLSNCKNNAMLCKINDACIAWTLTYCKNNALDCKINDICIAWMLVVKTTQLIVKSMIYVLPGC